MKLTRVLELQLTAILTIGSALSAAPAFARDANPKIPGDGWLVDGPGAAPIAWKVPTTTNGVKSKSKCPTVFLGLHGLGEDPPPAANSKVLDVTWEKLKSLADLSGADLQRHDVPFPKMTVPQFLDALNLFKNKDIPSPINDGVDLLWGEVNSDLRKCGTTQFVLVGYSEGAWIVDKWLHGNANVDNMVKGIALFGDPQWSEGRGATGGNGLARLYGFGLDPYRPTSAYLNDRFLSFCNPLDAVCGRGYGGLADTLVRQPRDARLCETTDCPHKQYLINQPEEAASKLAVWAFEQPKPDPTTSNPATPIPAPPVVPEPTTTHPIPDKQQEQSEMAKPPAGQPTASLPSLSGRWSTDTFEVSTLEITGNSVTASLEDGRYECTGTVTPGAKAPEGVYGGTYSISLPCMPDGTLTLKSDDTLSVAIGGLDTVMDRVSRTTPLTPIGPT